MRFGSDWPGVFIRGDNAKHFAMWLRDWMAGHYDFPAKQVIEGLVAELESCDAATDPECQQAVTRNEHLREVAAARAEGHAAGLEAAARWLETEGMRYPDKLSTGVHALAGADQKGARG